MSMGAMVIDEPDPLRMVRSVQIQLRVGDHMLLSTWIHISALAGAPLILQPEEEITAHVTGEFA